VRRTGELTRGSLDAIAGLVAQADCDKRSRKGASMSSEPDATRVALVTGGSGGIAGPLSGEQMGGCGDGENEPSSRVANASQRPLRDGEWNVEAVVCAQRHDGSQAFPLQTGELRIVLAGLGCAGEVRPRTSVRRGCRGA
jgi:hypothetical protein